MADPAAAHLRRNAYIYVRQSTLVQTVRNTESLLRQYDLAGRARELGWAEHQIVVFSPFHSTSLLLPFSFSFFSIPLSYYHLNPHY